MVEVAGEEDDITEGLFFPLQQMHLAGGDKVDAILLYGYNLKIYSVSTAAVLEEKDLIIVVAVWLTGVILRPCVQRNEAKGDTVPVVFAEIVYGNDSGHFRTVKIRG